MTYVSRTETCLLDPERAQLEAFLHDQREELLEAVEGLSEEQARRRLVPSLTTPLALLKHAAFVEKVWFQVGLQGRTRAELGMPEEAPDSFLLTDADTVATVAADFREAVAASERIAAQHGLDDLVLHNRRSPMSLRWVYLHMIREFARHAGHADILREQLLATDG